MRSPAITLQPLAPAAPKRALAAARMASRNAAERRFRLYGILAIAFGLGFLGVLMSTLIAKGHSAFQQSSFRLEVPLDPAVIDPSGKLAENELLSADYMALANTALQKALAIGTASKSEVLAASSLISENADTHIRNLVMADKTLIGKTVVLDVLATSNVDLVLKGQFDRSVEESARKLSDKQLAWIDKAAASGLLSKRFNWDFFRLGASSQPETAGIGAALIGSLFMMLTVVLLALPLGVGAAIYLEEFAPKNRLTDVIEVNINNLAAVPSIVFGLLGLAIFINFAGLPRSASLVGGLVLTLMTLPTIIIATRAAFAAVPPSIREAAIGIGASKMQSVMHHVLPLALPGILTGTIIGLAKALGETAPLLMIGMVAFVVQPPSTPLEPATALPVQIYMWATAAERGFAERTSGATLVLLAILVCVNVMAVILRRKYENRW